MVMDVDASTSTENSKKQKGFEGQNTGWNGDRLSNLPDSILHCIISLLPTKFAVATSVLSTRWKHLWTSIHNLEFCDSLLYSTARPGTKSSQKKKEAFIAFVNRVLLLNDVSDVQKFEFRSTEAYADHFNEWIFNVTTRKVQEVVISIKKKHQYCLLPHCLFTCESLRILKIEMRVCIEFPASFCFPNLMVLHLKDTAFSSDQWMQNISLSCPILEEFFLHNSKLLKTKCVNVSAAAVQMMPNWICFSSLKVMHLKDVAFSRNQTTKDICFSFPMLEDFFMHNCTWFKIRTVSISAPKLQMLTIEDRERSRLLDCVFKIYAKSLVSLKLTSCLSFEYSLNHLGDIISNADSFPREICGVNVKHLELSAYNIDTLSLPDVLANILRLSNLMHLRVMRGPVSSVMPICGVKLIELLCETPNMESLFFPDGLRLFDFRGCDRIIDRIIGTIPECFLLHLKLVDVTNFRWTDDELWFVKFLIKNATVMDKLTIKVMTCSSIIGRRYHVDMRERITKQIQLFARDSKCEVEFA